MRSFQSFDLKTISLWKLMLRDGLNLYGVRIACFYPAPESSNCALGYRPRQPGQHAVLVHRETKRQQRHYQDYRY